MKKNEKEWSLETSKILDHVRIKKITNFPDDIFLDKALQELYADRISKESTESRTEAIESWLIVMHYCSPNYHPKGSIT